MTEILFKDHTLIDFNPLKENVGVMLSGGADSSVVFWLLAKEGCSIMPFTVDRNNTDIDKVNNIIDWVNSDLGTNISYTTVVGNNTLPHYEQVKSGHREAFLKYNIDEIYVGATQNPPITLPGNPPYRPTKIDHPKIKAPFLLCDKRHIFELYKKYNLMDLFNLTHSCEISTESSCRKCFSCNEREWALNGL